MDQEAVKREIIRLIDDHWDPWVKAAYYSDPIVSRIMDRLLEAWSGGGETGRPIDYATEDELLELLSKARVYSRLDTRTAMSVAMRNMYSGDDDYSEEEGPGILGVFRKLFSSRGRRGASL